ncbi:MAG TPA: PAS domain S-box protein [Syntrophales bacterium]|nr:PAS domain S-box protein [Syntrophales bacterium]
MNDLQLEKDKSEKTLYTIGDGVISVDHKGKILFINRAAQSLVGMDTSEAVGRQLEDVYVLRQGQENRVREKGGILTSKEGKEYVIEEVRTPLAAMEFGKSSVVIVFRDITERKRAGQMLLQQWEELSHVSRLATLGEFAASIAHQVHQPLAAILNNAQAAQRFLSSGAPAIDEVRDALQDIIDDDRRASEVIRHLRSFLKRIDADQAILDINTVIEEVLTILHHEIVDRHVYVTLALSPDIPHVVGDRIQLQQVLMNLILK